jgi:Eukaryotic aspartyl protease
MYADHVCSVGNDGPWSTTTVRVGNPEQYFQLLISTAGQETWVIDPLGCSALSPPLPQCLIDRGQTFNHSGSTTYSEIGLFALGLEDNLGYNSSGDYGFDEVGLGFQESDGPKLSKQVVASVADKNVFLGEFGIGPNSINFTDSNDHIPSFFTTLKANNSIPSLSWAYTAGAHYSKS